ncbi:hypothetical protein WNY37_10500 [Henriciella sp. AS95]|uniref:hypothetical protein n=1 Tax=Henriciella sp. AS95 TaxID=3135782 RepID=UPI00317AC07D
MSDTNEQMPPDDVPDEEQARLAAQKKRNLWLAVALFAFVIIVGLTTVIRLGEADLGEDGGIYWRNDPGTADQAPMPVLPGDDAGQTEEAPE